MVRIKYLNNLVEQDHRNIKKRIRPMLGFKSFVSASATLEGIEVANMIRKGQMTPGRCPFALFADLADQRKEKNGLFPLKAELCDKARQTLLVPDNSCRRNTFGARSG